MIKLVDQTAAVIIIFMWAIAISLAYAAGQYTAYYFFWYRYEKTYMRNLMLWVKTTGGKISIAGIIEKTGRQFLLPSDALAFIARYRPIEPAYGEGYELSDAARPYFAKTPDPRSLSEMGE